MTSLEKAIERYEESCRAIEQATEILPEETQGEKDARIKRLEANYVKWFEYYFPNYASAPTAWYHKQAAQFLLDNPIAYLAFEVFRGGAKSVHSDMGIPLFLMVKEEMRFMLLIGENADKAKTLLSDVQAQLKNNRRLINDYGEMFKYGDWKEGSFTTKEGIHFHSLGLGQSPRGLREMEQRPDYIVADDLDTKERCKNPRRIREAVEWIMEDLWGTFDEGRARFVIANNRIHKNSILANMVRHFANAAKRLVENSLPVVQKHIKVNAVKNLKTFEPNWPGKYTAEFWRKKYYGTTHRSFMREYQNTPIEDGAIFKRDWIKYKRILPLDEYDALVVYGDLSYKTNGDYKAIKFWGKKGKEFHLIATYVRQSSRQQAAEWLYDLYQRLNLNNFNIRYEIEGLFAQDEFVSDFDREGDKRGFHIPVVASKRGKGDKFDRIESISGHWERRNVYYNIELMDDPDLEEDIDQLMAFEKGSGANDDAPDADHGAFSLLEKDTFVASFTPRIGKRRKKHGY